MSAHKETSSEKRFSRNGFLTSNEKRLAVAYRLRYLAVKMLEESAELAEAATALTHALLANSTSLNHEARRADREWRHVLSEAGDVLATSLLVTGAFGDWGSAKQAIYDHETKMYSRFKIRDVPSLIARSILSSPRFWVPLSEQSDQCVIRLASAKPILEVEDALNGRR